MRLLISAGKGAAYAGAAWLLYGIVETLLPLGEQFWKQPEVAFMPWQWSWVVILFSLYGLAGILIGLVAGVALVFANTERVPGSYQIAAVLSITGAFCLHEIMRGPYARSRYLAIAVAAALALAFLRALFSKQVSARIMFLTGPITVSLLLLGASWAQTNFRRPRRVAMYWLLWSVTIVLLGLIANRLRQRRPPAMIGQLVTAAVLLGTFFAGAVLSRPNPLLLVDPNAMATERGKPNVILVTMDTVRADHVQMFGYNQNTTPNLQAFSRAATVYPNAIATSDFTLPTHGSIFTGLYPAWHGAEVDKSLRLPFGRMSPDPPTLAESLRSHGYATAAVVANYGFPFPDFGVMRGFATLDWRRPAYLNPMGLGLVALTAMDRLASSRLPIAPPVSPVDLEPRRAADINRSAFELLRQASTQQRPVFLFVNYMDAHAPYAPVPPFEQEFADSAPRPGHWPIDRQAVIDGTDKLDPAQRRYLTSQYDGAIATEDSAIADLLTELRRLGLYDNSLIIITADHGEALGERGVVDHGLGTVYQDLVHVPLIIKYPRQSDAARSDLLASQVDLMPTILDVAGVEASNLPLQGKSLQNLAPQRKAVAAVCAPSEATASCGGVRGAGPADSRAIFIEAQDGVWKVNNPRLMGLRRAVLQGDMKYIAWTNGPPELYDLASDPGEQHDLYRAGDPKAEALAKLLHVWVATMPPRKVTPQQIDKGAIERLKSLGYVQ